MLKDLADCILTINNLHTQDTEDFVAQASQSIVEAHRNGNKVILAGNGGSFSQAQHFAAELTGWFSDRTRDPIGAVVLGSNSATLTAISNDSSYEEAYNRELRSIYRPGDVVILFSTSGNSRNIASVLHGLPFSKIPQPYSVFSFLGGNRDCTMSKNVIGWKLFVPSTDVARIQEAHLVVSHVICKRVDELLGEK